MNKIKYSLKNLYDIDYEKVAGQTLWGMRLFIFAKPEHTKKMTHFQFSQVRTGIGNALGELLVSQTSQLFFRSDYCLWCNYMIIVVKEQWAGL